MPRKSGRTTMGGSYRATPEWMAWLERLRAHLARPGELPPAISDLIEQGLGAVARKAGFAEPMPPRLPPEKKI